MIKKVLIANRGEIAVRIIRACHELGIETVSIYSEADHDSLHRKLATESYCIGPKLSKDSYLDMIGIITIAQSTGCDAIHPGYGFLAENSDFAEMCESSSLIFIGPMSETISLMGVKDVAKKTMIEADVPTVPGSDGVVKSLDDAYEIAEEIGYPIIIKASHGGGGKGIRVARTKDELTQNYKLTEQEAESAFGNKSLYIEKYIENFRHIEIQVLGDYHGNVVHLGERDCTVQRRMQKLVEEAPSPVISEKTRLEMGETAVRAAKSIDIGMFSFKNVGEFQFADSSVICINCVNNCISCFDDIACIQLFVTAVGSNIFVHFTKVFCNACCICTDDFNIFFDIGIIAVTFEVNDLCVEVFQMQSKLLIAHLFGLQQSF